MKRPSPVNRPRRTSRRTGRSSRTIVASGALDIRTERAGNDTTFAKIVSLVEEAEESQAPIQRLADRVVAWLIPVMIIFLVIVFIAIRN